jgi:hypothetical protein
MEILGCDSILKQQLRKTKGTHRYAWNMKVGRFDCLTELYTTNRDLSAYKAAPGNYKVRLKVGEFTQTQDWILR